MSPDFPALHRPVHPVRVVTAASRFDGHDAAITVMRRILVQQGAEVIHLGHDRSARDVAIAAIEEDAAAIAVSSYQGGHIEYFTYLAELLREAGADQVRIYGGGGGVIVPAEIALLAERGIRIFSPADGQQLGLPGMVNVIVRECDRDRAASPAVATEVVQGSRVALARAITQIEQGRADSALLDELRAAAALTSCPIVGITGTGGSGKSSLTDELVRRFQNDVGEAPRIAIVAIDPTRSRHGGALLGDRIRMNALTKRTMVRSLATRGSSEVPEHLPDILTALRASGVDLVIVETPGIGQGDAGIAPHVDLAMYVMTPEYGAATQLEKIDMLDFADIVVINKFERPGADDARRDVARQLIRNRGEFGRSWESMPVFGTSAAHFNDSGVNALYRQLRRDLTEHGLPDVAMDSATDSFGDVDVVSPIGHAALIPAARTRYLAEIADEIRRYHAHTDDQVDLAARRQGLRVARAEVANADAACDAIDSALERIAAHCDPDLDTTLDRWRNLDTDDIPTVITPSGTPVPRVAVPRFTDDGAALRFLREENLPGQFPFTAGVFAFKRETEAPARMFAGEGDPARTNRRFHLLSEGQPATRLSTAFDSVTLYGRDPSPEPDVYGKVGTSGVSVATLDDMSALYAGFDLCDPTTSVSMTINGPAPAVLAMFLNTAIDQQVEFFRQREHREPTETEREELRTTTLATVRGTVQADILKEDQGQNTCLFSTEFSLRCMADVEQWFIDNRVRNFYSVSVSGYHIAEAGANPISQLAFTLANAFTYVEAYLARGMRVDDFAPHFSFFFSNGMDAEYTVLGRVARRIWAIALKERYGADERAQKLKYHVQTSGRSLHAQEMDFNDIRTTLQALCAINDNCNSLHTNAYDEAVTTPSAQSVRRALAIQMIIDQEWGLTANENPLQGSYIVEDLTRLVEAAVLDEFDRLSMRGGVLGAMETGYQRGRIQDESMQYEQHKHDGTLPIIGVNTFVAAETELVPSDLTLSRATEQERASQLAALRDFHQRHRDEAPAALEDLRQAATSGGNVFEELMSAVRVCSLGQITDAFFAVGGQYRRAM